MFGNLLKSGTFQKTILNKFAGEARSRGVRQILITIPPDEKQDVDFSEVSGSKMIIEQNHYLDLVNFYQKHKHLTQP